MSRSCLAVVLAAGEGKRMLSTKPKVLHKIAGLEMVCHVLTALRQADCDKIALIIGRQGDEIEKSARAFEPELEIYRQDRPLGTAHATLTAREALQQEQEGEVLIVFGDTPLLQAQDLIKMRMRLSCGADLVVSGFSTPNPTGYGRLIEKSGRLVAIIEEKDATIEQRQITFCNGGVMAISGKYALSLLDQVNNDNVAGEYYLPDIVALAHAQGLNVQAVKIEAENILGVNTRVELAAAEALWQDRKRQAIMAQGVTLIAPQTVYFAHDSDIDMDVVIEPNVFFGPGVKVKRAARIRAFSHLEGAVIGENAEIGPFARLRSGTHLQEHVKVGNFCEIKQTQVAAGAKINHLSYIGDAEIGAHVNIGAGTITCNYDGINKWQTVVGAGAFIGSNSALIAPVSVGAGAYVASGSVITQNVEPQALAFGRARQINKPERAQQLRQHQKPNLHQ